MRAVLIVGFLLAALTLPQMWSLSSGVPAPRTLGPLSRTSFAAVDPGTGEPGGPRHLAPADARSFLERHDSARQLTEYLREPGRTPWGVIVEDAGRDFLVFRDARARIHVVDVTAEPIASEIGKSAYSSSPFDAFGLR